MSFDTAVVGLDLSPSSFSAAREARALVAREGRLVLVTIIERTVVTAPPRHEPPEEIDAYRRKLEGEARAKLEALARELTEGTAIAAKVIVRLGQPVTDLLEIVAREGAGLLAVGAHSRTAVERFVFGSVAEALVRQSPVPTLVARPWNGHELWRRVLVAVDHTPPARAAAMAAREIAKTVGAPVEILHALTWEAGGRTDPGPVAIKELAESAGLLEAPVRILVGMPSAVIAEYVAPGDLLVCGTRASGPLARAFLGSVATNLLRRAPCTVVVVRARSTEERA